MQLMINSETYVYNYKYLATPRNEYDKINET